MPMGRMTVQDLPKALMKSLKIRRLLSDEHEARLKALSTHLSTDQYCLHLMELGAIDNCDWPPTRDDPKPNDDDPPL